MTLYIWIKREWRLFVTETSILPKFLKRFLVSCPLIIQISGYIGFSQWLKLNNKNCSNLFTQSKTKDYIFADSSTKVSNDLPCCCETEWQIVSHQEIVVVNRRAIFSYWTQNLGLSIKIHATTKIWSF